jgi:hypothetical protein
VPTAQIVFATDYPQAVRDDKEVVAYIDAVRALGSDGRNLLGSANAEKLIPNLNKRLTACTIECFAP